MVRLRLTLAFIAFLPGDVGLFCQYAVTDKVSLALEWLSIKTHHYGWVFYDIDDTATERQAQLTLRARF